MLVGIDFEFTGSNQKQMNVICASMSFEDRLPENFWLHDDFEKSSFISRVDELHSEGAIFLAYVVTAEARSFSSIGLNPLSYNWIDLHFEDRMCVNSNNKWGYGQQLIKGKIKRTVNKLKWGMSEQELMKYNFDKPETSYSAACYRYLKELIDTDEKNEVRDLIITKERDFTEAERNRIQKYCESDVEFLIPMFKVINRYYKQKLGSDQKQNMLGRGRYACLNAKMEEIGYPVHKEWFPTFIENCKNILRDCKLEIMEWFKGSSYCPFAYKERATMTKFQNGEELSDRQREQVKGWLKEEPLFKTKNVRAWIKEKTKLAKFWTKTDKGALSLSADAFAKHFNFNYNYPQDNLAAQIIRYLKLKQTLNGFLPGSRRSILDFMGLDFRVRAYLNPFGSQTSRTQPSSTGFLFLKTPASRSLVHPFGESTFLCGIDYASQEVLIQAILSGDRALYEAYISGDVYLDFAIKAKAVPKGGKRKDYEDIRNKFKSTFLGISYGMGAKALARKLTADTGKPVNELEAEELIDMFNSVFHVYAEYLDNYQDEYEVRGYAILPDGWVLWGDNPNAKSVRNFPVQGHGAVIMRRAVELCYQRNIPIVFTLHDALYAEISSKEQLDDFNDALKQAVFDVFPHDWSKDIRTDINCWGSFFEKNGLDFFKDSRIKTQTVYIDERSKRDFDFLSKYFT